MIGGRLTVSGSATDRKIGGRLRDPEIGEVGKYLVQLVSLL